MKTILNGVTESSSLVTQISRASDEQMFAVRKVNDSINTASAKAREIAVSTAEQAQGATTIAQTAVQMRKGAREV